MAPAPRMVAHAGPGRADDGGRTRILRLGKPPRHLLRHIRENEGLARAS